MTQEIDISNLTSSEVNSLIFKGKGSTEFVEMPMWIANQIIDMPWLEQSLRDWAWNEVLSELENC